MKNSTKVTHGLATIVITAMAAIIVFSITSCPTEGSSGGGGGKTTPQTFSLDDLGKITSRTTLEWGSVEDIGDAYQFIITKSLDIQGAMEAEKALALVIANNMKVTWSATIDSIDIDPSITDFSLIELTGQGSFEFADGGAITLDNDNITIINSGVTAIAVSGGSLTASGDGSTAINTAGDVTITGGSITASGTDGTAINAANIIINGITEIFGKVEGAITVAQDAALKVKEDAMLALNSLDIAAGGELLADGTIINTGNTITNSGIINIGSSGRLENEGMITNNNIINNNGIIVNSETINNYGTITNEGTITNNGEIYNYGTYEGNAPGNNPVINAIASAAITVTAPVVDATPVTAANGTGNFTMSAVTWAPAHNPFAYSIQYTATVTLTANANYFFTSNTTATINGDAAAITNNTGTAMTVSLTFPPAVGPTINIATPQDLANVGKAAGYPLNANYIQTADIISNGNWAPIGSTGDPFTGTYDGGGYAISGLTINQSGNDYHGLFAVIGTYGVVKNLGIVSCTITGSDFVGGVAGYNDKGIIENCYVTGSVTGSSNVGGVAGANTTGTILNCYSAATVTGVYNVGGVAGYNDSTVQRCYATGNISGNTYVGGVVGSSKGTVQNCYSTGNVTATGSLSGGVVGESEGGTLQNCYATGNVTGGDIVGGIAGRSLTLLNCVALNSSVTKTDNNLGINIGRVAGLNPIGTITNSYGRSSMTLTASGETVTAASNANDIHGADILAENTLTQTWWTAAAWNSASPWAWNTVWNNANGSRLPTLTGMPTAHTQNPTIPDVEPPEPAGEGTITMVTFRDTPFIYLIGNEITINWGDGNVDIKTGYYNDYVSHPTGSAPYNITITGGVTFFDCTGIDLTQLEINNCPELKNVYCDSNELTELNISNCPSLEILSCWNNQLTSLNITGCPALIELNCRINQLTSLDLSDFPALKKLDYRNNKLANLNVSACLSLEWLDCQNNGLDAAQLNALFGTLFDRSELSYGYVYISDNPGTAGCNPSIATAKGWSVY